MKKLYSVVLVIFTVSSAFANPVITAVSGDWENNSTWNLNRVPKDGDTIVIPAGKTVVIDDVENLSSDFLYVKVYGTLKLAGG
jgi:hypothetical protein